MNEGTSLLQKCRKYLHIRWQYICQHSEDNEKKEQLELKFADIKKLIIECLTSKTKTYHYVLPTQILCKCVDSSLDCHSVQASYKKSGAFDARTIAHGVIVPFDQVNYYVFGGPAEPYVNNPLRCPAITGDYRNQQKNKNDWDKLIRVLDLVEERNNKTFTANIFDQILFEIHKLLANVRILYPTPNRISLNQTIALISQFTSDKSGGDRIEAVCTALFKTIGEHFNLFDEVKREKVTTADAASGMVSDIECWLKRKVVLLVEVKDRTFTLTQLDSKLDIARAKAISEILFLAEKGLDKSDEKQARELIKSEFTSGQNVYVSNFIDFSAGILILVGEKGRVIFLSNIGPELDRVNSSIEHRRTWANLLKSV